MDIFLLKLESVLEIHAYQLGAYGGIAGTRDQALLESAVAMPAAMFAGQYLHRDIFEMAAAYLFHLVKNHPFLDGNKRVGAGAAATFLRMNGIRMTASNGEFADLTLEVARGNADKPVIAQFFRDNFRPV